MCWRGPWSTATAWAIAAQSRPGDVQWMTAGSGIIHQEMPKGDQAGRMHGFQLWANLPASLKMTAPRYQEVKAPDIPEITDDDGTQVRVVCGNFWGKTGPGGRDRGRADLPRCVGAPGTAEDASGGDHAPRLRVCVCRERGSSAMRPVRWRCRRKESAGRIRRTAVGSGQPLAGAVRPRRRSDGAGGTRTASGFCWFRASRWRSRWHGTARS